MTPSVAVLRHSLYLPSERFIPDQARATGVSPLMLSRDQIVDPVDGLRTVALADDGSAATVRYTLARDPRPLMDILRRERSELLHAHFGVEGMYASRAAARLRIPQITTLHGFDVSRSTSSLLAARRPAWAHYAAGRRRFLQQAEHLICVSQHVRRRAIAGGARGDAIRVITTGVDTAAIVPTPVPDGATIVHVARLVEKKGTADLIHAFARVARSVDGARLVIVGDGPLRRQLTSLVAELGLTERVSFRGAQRHTDVLATIAAGDLLCLPSVTASTGDQEGLPQVVLEAGALGRPVVSTLHGGIPEGVVHGTTGVLVDEHDVSALADGLSALLGDHALAQRMGSAAREVVSSTYDLTRQAARVAEFYRDAANS